MDGKSKAGVDSIRNSLKSDTKLFTAPCKETPAQKTEIYKSNLLKYNEQLNQIIKQSAFSKKSL